jgi:hypothetical protein
MSDLIKQRLTEPAGADGFGKSPAATPTPSPTPEQKKDTLRSYILDTFGIAGQIALEVYEKDGAGVKFYLDKEGKPIAEVVEKGVFNFNGVDVPREKALKVLDMEK